MSPLDYTASLIEKIEDLEARFDLSPFQVFELQLEAAAVAFILGADEAQQEELRRPSTDPNGIAQDLRDMASRTISHLKSVGVTKANARQYILDRLTAVEATALPRPHSIRRRPKRTRGA